MTICNEINVLDSTQFDQSHLKAVISQMMSHLKSVIVQTFKKVVLT